jgi:hypothetical protein
VRVAAIINTRKRKWEAIIQVPTLPAPDNVKLAEVLYVIREIPQPDNWPEKWLPVYYYVDWYGYNREYIRIVPVELGSDLNFYSLINTYAIFRVDKKQLVEHGYWTPRFIDVMLSALT